VICPAVAIKVAVGVPCLRRKVKVGGRVRRGLLLVSVTCPSGPAEAMTVHVVEVAEVRVAGKQETEEMSAEADKVRLAVAEAPL
jgi:hypothetical protein